jgi:hypothetical protein
MGANLNMVVTASFRFFKKEFGEAESNVSTKILLPSFKRESEEAVSLDHEI